MKVTARCTRTDGWWAIEVDEVDGLFTQTRRLDQVPAMVADALALLEDIDNIEVEVLPVLASPLDTLVENYARARATADAATDAVASASRDTVTNLVERGLTMRDIGQLMGISPQRVSQIHTQAARSAA